MPANRGRAASNLRAHSHKETDKERREREKAEKLRLKEFEPIKPSKQVDGKSRYGAAGECCSFSLMCISCISAHVMLSAAYCTFLWITIM